MITILIADDERIERQFLRRLFESQGGRYRVAAEAGSGVEAVELAERLRPDVIILDINMPGCSGLEAARRIRACRPEQIIILNSAYAEFTFATEAIRQNLNGYLLKPSQEEEIFATIDTCLQRSQPLRGPETEPLAGFGSGVSYPFAQEEMLLEALAAGNCGRAALASGEIAAFVEKQPPCDDYRLYLINLIFSVERTLSRRSGAESLLPLLGSAALSQQLLQARGGDRQALLLRHYFSNLLLVLEQASRQPQDYLGQAAEYIRAHFRERVTLTELSRCTHLSPSYLSRLFHEKYGCSIPHYVNALRVRWATELLRTSGQSIKEIARECGFADSSDFYRVYKKYTGRLPAEVRKESGDEN